MVAIGVGLIYHAIGVAVQIRQSLVTGDWSIISGAVTFLWRMAGPAAIVLTAGAGLLLFTVMPAEKE